MPSQIYQLVYRSKHRLERIDNALQMLRDIVKSSARNNKSEGITGYLIFDGENFLQILEGDLDVVEATYARIEADPRHREAEMLLTRTAEERQFPEWSMGGYLQTMPISPTVSGEDAIALATQRMSSGKTMT
jgi:hypothetical protein